MEWRGSAISSVAMYDHGTEIPPSLYLQVWARCDALTAGLAGELAEQLRLILEPTLASRLAGDYRTGGYGQRLGDLAAVFVLALKPSLTRPPTFS